MSGTVPTDEFTPTYIRPLLADSRISSQTLELHNPAGRALAAARPVGRRSSVTAAAAILRSAGAIDYRRAVIKILDREKLRSMVCECYSTIRRTIDVGFNTHPPADIWA